MRGKPRLNQGVSPALHSDLMFLPLLAGFGVHVWLALSRIYGVGRWPALGPTVVLLAALTALILVYRQAITVVVAVLT